VSVQNTSKEHSNNVRSRYSEIINEGKGKAIPLQALTGPESLRRLRLPYFKTISRGRWKGQPYAPAAFTPRKYFWYSFMLEAESTPGP
jgi:hypothetical protein